VIYEDRVVEEPETLVEHLTYADIAGGALLTVFSVLALVLALATNVGLLAPALEAIGGLGVLALLVGLLVLAYGGALLLGVSALATLAVASARHDLATDADDPTDA
jgi:protein-S-isoprenylcysteine O-methyltransferase Ste14